MKKTLFLILSIAFAITAGAQEKMAVCKHSSQNKNLANYHLYDRSKIDRVDLGTYGKVRIFTGDDEHIYDKANIDSIVFTRPANYEDIGYPAFQKFFINEDFSNSLGVFEVSTPKGISWDYSTQYKCALASGFKDNKTTPSETYLYSSEFDFTNTTEASLEFSYKMNYAG